jgi:hypothetical protein
MTSKRRLGRHCFNAGALLLAAAALLTMANGCSKKKEVDPYVYGSLRDVTRGNVESVGFLFEIDCPEFVYIDGNTAIVRDPNDPNLLELLVADDLENRAPSWQGKLLGVQKFFSPAVYLMVRRVKDGMTTTAVDSCENFVLPHFTDPKLEEISGFDLSKMPYNARSREQKDMEDRVGMEFQTAGRVELRPDYEWKAPEPKPGEKVADGEEAPQAPMVWYLVSADNDKAVFKISNVSKSLGFALKLLTSQDLPFVGAVKINTINPYRQRRREEVTGDLDIQFVTYANRYLAP